MEAIQHYLPQGVPVSIQVVLATIVLGAVYSYITADRPFTGFPIVAVDGHSPKKSWTQQGRKVIADGVKKFSGPFQVITGTGPKIVLPNRYADELRSHPDLSFAKAFSRDFMMGYPGFEGLGQGLVHDHLLQDTIRIKLTQSLGLITEDLVDETISSIDDVFGVQDQGWTTRLLKEDILEVVARLSSRVFLGRDLCRNRRWLEIAKTYTVDVFVTSRIMRAIPALVRPLSYLMIPQAKSLRAALRDAHGVIDPEVIRRKKRVDEAKAAGQKPPKTADTIGWMYELSEGQPVDYVASQLGLTLAAIHTTTESTCTAILDMCRYPAVQQQLREEVIQVLGENGWAKTSLYKLRFMDSFLKEGQRLSPLSQASMNRYVEREIKLSDGTVLPKGSRVMVAGNHADPTIYPEPEKFIADRFAKKREEAGQENSWQLVTPSADHFLFGYGQHACPGRFFAGNEIKIALCHLVLKYDWRFIPGAEPVKRRAFEAAQSVDPETKIQAKRRTPEIDIDNL